MPDLAAHYSAVLFDLGNTLVAAGDPSVPLAKRPVRFLPGALELVNALHGRVPLAIVSNTDTFTAGEITEALGDAASFFDLIVATADLGVHKPDPAPLLHAARELGTECARMLYIGDASTDRTAALAAGMDFMWTGVDLTERVSAQLAERTALGRAVASARVPDEAVRETVLRAFDGLAKPAGSLGRLESYVAQVAAVQHSTSPTVDPFAVAVFVADHGIAADDTVTPWPQAITSIMRDVIGEGGAAISVLAGNADAYLDVTDVGTALTPLEDGDARVAAGTRDLRQGPAMTREEAMAALEAGAQTAERLIAGGTRVLAVGEVGIGNTTAAAALISAFTGLPADTVTGRGSGVDDATYERKVDVVASAVAAIPENAGAIDILASVGGLEIAAIAGAMLSAASVGVPVLLDGVITQAAALCAAAIDASVTGSLLAAHRSAEPGSIAALAALGLDPVLDLGLRLGEGTGAALALPVLRGGCLALGRMAAVTDLLSRL